MKSRATSTRQCYRGGPRTSQRPRVSRHAGYARSIATSCKRKPFGGCSLDLIAAIAMVARARATGGGFPEVIQLLPAAHMHPGCIAHRTRRLQAEQPARIGRQVAGRCSESRKRVWTRVYHPNAQALMPGCARTAGTYQCVTSASLKPHGRVLFSTRASLP